MQDTSGCNQHIEIVSFCYSKASPAQRNQIDALVRNVWQMKNSEEVHSSFFEIMSFCAYLGEHLVGYAGVLQWNLHVEQNIFSACGLSCVCTDPEYRCQGIGSRVVGEATRWIVANKSFDVGLFTCNPHYTAFYEQTNIWKKDDSIILRGSESDEFISPDMGLDVLRAVLSDKAQNKVLMNTTLVLHFPKGQFI